MIADPFNSVIPKGLDYQTPKMLKSHNSYSDSDSDGSFSSDKIFNLDKNGAREIVCGMGG